MDQQNLYETRSKRIEDAINLKEPDQVPINTLAQGFQPNDSGHTMAEAVYDMEIAAQSVLEFAEHYETDSIIFQNESYYGMGKALEVMQPTRLDWAGKPGGKNSDRYIHQILEFSTLHDDEIEEFNTDFSGWMMRCGWPRVSRILEPLSDIHSFTDGPSYDIRALAAEFNTPKFRDMIQTLWKLDEMCKDVDRQLEQLDEKLNGRGFVTPLKASAWVPLDCYGAFLRGTEDCLMDLYENEETVLQFCDRDLEAQQASIRMQGSLYPGKWCAFYLTKASDQFMGAEHFQKYYWKYLQKMIEETINSGMVPYVYTEGHFNSRLEFLKDVPKGVIYHFESMVDMARAKELLGKDSCIAGGFPIADLLFGTRETVIEKAKRLLDICMPGGGYIFETEAGFDEAKRENVEALYETVRKYGKY